MNELNFLSAEQQILSDILFFIHKVQKGLHSRYLTNCCLRLPLFRKTLTQRSRVCIHCSYMSNSRVCIHCSYRSALRFPKETLELHVQTYSAKRNPRGHFFDGCWMMKLYIRMHFIYSFPKIAFYYILASLTTHIMIKVLFHLTQPSSIYNFDSVELFSEFYIIISIIE